MKITKKQLKRIIKEELKKVLSEGNVVVNGLTAWTEDYRNVEVTLDGVPITVPSIFDQLNSHGEYEGWKNNVPEEGRESFYSDHVGSAIEYWAEEMGHRYEAPDYY